MIQSLHTLTYWKNCLSWQCSKDYRTKTSLLTTTTKSMLFMFKKPIKESRFNTVSMTTMTILQLQ
jgi:hypothetical protein